MEEPEQDKQAQAQEALMHHLLEAIEQVRLDMAKVELWAYAVTGFSRPVPEYDPSKMKMWLPPEQAKKLETSTESYHPQTKRSSTTSVG